MSAAVRSAFGALPRSTEVAALIVASAMARQERKVQICVVTVPAKPGTSARWICDQSVPQSSIVPAQAACHARYCRRTAKASERL